MNQTSNQHYVSLETNLMQMFYVLTLVLVVVTTPITLRFLS